MADPTAEKMIDDLHALDKFPTTRRQVLQVMESYAAQQVAKTKAKCAKIARHKFDDGKYAVSSHAGELIAQAIEKPTKK